jgi:hypothetical protein
MTGSGLDARNIEVPCFEPTEIEVVTYNGDRARLIQVQEAFTQAEDAVYPLREANGNLMEAL